MIYGDKGFWISKYEVTEREYWLATKRRSRTPLGNNFPYIDARNGDANRFAENLTRHEVSTGDLSDGWRYSLPDESQWEYACRAGSNTAYSFGDDAKKLVDYGNFATRELFEKNPSEFRYAHRDLSDKHATVAPVGSYLPNRWGIHDMHGNVWEWCSNRYRQALNDILNADPKAKVFDDRGKTIRGGSYLSKASYCRSSMRNAQHDLNAAPYLGFRIVLVQESK